MTLIPQRTVANQVAAQIRQEVAKGTWRGWLPSERMLCELVQASRNTVRAALGQLRAEGVVEPVHGLGTRVIATPEPAGASDQPKTVGVIVPGPIGSLRPIVALLLDELRDLLIEAGCRLRLHESPQLYRANPARALERLVDQHPHDAWLLVLSSEAMQRWFARRQVPCLVAGSTFSGVELPCHDLDYRATCRHAAGILLGAGHRRVALLNRETRRAGDLESELGFLEGVRGSPHADATVDIAYHGDDVESVARALKRVLDRPQPPTGILVSNSYAYLATASLLAQRGLRIPHDISLISRDNDPFLAAMVPSPARYVVSPHVLAKKMLATLLRLVAREKVPLTPSRLLPKYTSGDSLGPPRAAEPT